MIKTPHFVQRQLPEEKDLRTEIIRSLGQTQAVLSPKFFYDHLGSRLFEAITCTQEYYPTRTEAEIFKLCGAEIGRAVPHESILIDLGAGNCKKAASLFELLRPIHYVAIDISVDFLRDALESIQREHPDLNISGVGQDFSTDLRIPSELNLPAEAPKVFFYPGSSISNFSPEEALGFLKQIREHCEANPHSGLMIGVDLVKDKQTLELAYDDLLGVTAAFNKNALLNVNRIAQANFNLRDWQHEAIFNTEQLRIEMHLKALRPVELLISDVRLRHFQSGETIHTENSYKWLDSGFDELLHEAGFSQTTVWTDPQKWFAVYWAST